MIYKCGLSAWKASFTVTQRTRRGRAGRRGGRGERRGKNNVRQGDSVETGSVGRERRRQSRDGVGGKRAGDDSMLHERVRSGGDPAAPTLHHVTHLSSLPPFSVYMELHFRGGLGTQ